MMEALMIESNKETQFSLRVDETLRRQLMAAAKRSVRSLNGEIVFRLRWTFEQPSDAAPA
jgi:predicted HicB family RNase H-like nuclease